MTTAFVHISNDWSTLVRTRPEAIGSRAWNLSAGSRPRRLAERGEGVGNGHKDPTRGSHLWTCSYKSSPQGPYKNCHVFSKIFPAVPDRYLPSITREKWYWAFWKTKCPRSIGMDNAKIACVELLDTYFEYKTKVVWILLIYLLWFLILFTLRCPPFLVDLLGLFVFLIYKCF